MHSEEMLVAGADAAVPLLFRALDWNAPAQPVVTDAANDQMRLAELPQVLEAARMEERRRAEADLEAAGQSRVLAERQKIAAALHEFASEKRRYFAGVEKEVVRLALAIAERVLHRETAMDPTLLAGAARVALEQIELDSPAVMRVAPADAHAWRQAIPSVGRDVELLEDTGIERGACLLETAAGSFEIGLRAQLCEIERGFFELLGRTPAIAG